MKPNKYLLDILSPVEEEENDPKAKKAPAKGAPSPDENEGTNVLKIAIDVANADEEKKKLSLKINCVFQGPDYEEEAPEEEDPKKKGKADDGPKMVTKTPEPITIDAENGRQFEVQLGRYEDCIIEKTQQTPAEKEGDMENPVSMEGEEQEEKEPETEKRWIQYKFDQTKEEPMVTICTEGGLVCVEGITYAFDEGFSAGLYEIVITDVTRGIEQLEKLPITRIDLKLFDSVAEAEKAAEEAANKKKK